MPKKKRARYGDYCEIIDGKLYASVNLPIGNGKYKRKRKLVETKTDARNWALEQIERNKSGEILSKEKSFSDLAEWYKKEFVIPPFYKDGKKMHGLRTHKIVSNTLDRLEKEFGFYSLDKITVDLLRRYKRERLKTVSITPINREFALLRTMFKKARSRKWMKENPFDFGENLIEISLEGSRKPILNLRIAKRLLARSRKSEQPLLYYLILVAMNTGARPSEIMPYFAYNDGETLREPLIWKNILDFDFKAVLLVSYKGRIRKERIVPASEHLEKGLREMHGKFNPKPEDMLFPIKSFKTSWNTLTKSARCPGVWVRDFRHFFNSRIVVLPEFNDMERMLLLGQVKLSTNFRYSHLEKDFIDKFRNAVK